MSMTLEERLKIISILDKMERHPDVVQAMNITNASKIHNKEIKKDERTTKVNRYEKEK